MFILNLIKEYEMGEALLGKNRDSILKVENEGLGYWIKNFLTLRKKVDQFMIKRFALTEGG